MTIFVRLIENVSLNVIKYCMEQIIQTTIDSFDIVFCIVVNILTYLLIQFTTIINYKISDTPTKKRVILVIAVLLVGVVYYIFGSSIKLLLNSAILAPVFWSWVMKPILAHFDLDYSKYDIFEDFKL